MFKEYAENADALQDALMTVEDYSVIGRRAETWGNYDDSRRFRGLYDGKMRVELDSSRFAYRLANERKAPLGQTGLNNVIRDALRIAFDNIENVTNKEKRFYAVANSLDMRVPKVKMNQAVLERFVNTHSSISDAEIDDLINKGVVGTTADASACWRLEDVLDAPELYAAYPELREAVVGYEDLGSTSSRGYSVRKHIIINSRNKDAKGQADTLLHEIQHLIQAIEGFAGGSGRQYIRRQLDNAIAREKASLAHAQRRKAAQVGADSTLRDSHGLENEPRRNASRKRLTVLRALRYSERLIGFLGRFSSGIDEKYREFEFNLYSRAAGEIEARAVSRRRRMTALQRELHPFNRDAAQEYGEYGAIVTFPSEDFSVAGVKAAGIEDARKRGVTYVDPADGKKKFCIDTRGVRLSNGFTPGELSSIAPGGHKDTSLKSMVAFPELWRAYPELGNMRVRLMRPKNGSPGYYGFYDPEGGAEGQYICVNVTAVLAAKNPVTELLDTLLHEAQHAIQAHEGHSNGAGSMGQKGAQRYLGRAIQQRKQLGLDDEWAKANYDFMNKLLARVNRGDKMAIESVYWLSHGEQEARFAGAGYGEGASEAGMNPMTSLARMRGVGVRPDAESWMTVPLSRDITELGGVTFGNAGSHAGVMQSRLVPVGDFYTDRKEFQIREAMTRRTRELNKLATHGERGSTDFLLEALQVANTAVNMLPNGYRFGLEPYQMWLAEFSKLAGTGNIFAAANVVPMAFWQKIMRMSFENQAEGLLTQGAIPRRELEFWLNDKEAMEMLDRASDIVNKERAAVEHDLAGERPDATDKEATAKFEQRLLQELNNRLKANAELPKLEEGLIKKLGEMKIERVLARLLERVHLKFDEYRKDRTLGRIRRVVDSVYPTPGKDGKPQKGKMTADHYRKLDSYMRLMEMKRGEFDLWMNEHYPEGGEARWEDERFALHRPCRRHGEVLHCYARGRLSNGFTRGELSSIAAGGHKDTSLEIRMYDKLCA